MEDRARWLLLALTWLLTAAGCASRTVPLPPPEVTQVTSPDGDGLVAVTGFALEGASVGVLNEDTQEGVVVPTQGEDCGSRCPFEARLRAKSDDSLRVWQFRGTDNAIFPVVP